MHRPTGLALVTLISWLGCGGAPASEPTTTPATAAPPEAPAEPEEASGTVDDNSGSAVVTSTSGASEAPAAELDKEEIRRLIRTQLPAILACYEQGLARRPELAGKVTVSFQIEETGSVSSSSASGLGDAQVESCVAKAIEEVQFPPGEDRGIIVVSYPFTLKPKPD